MIALFAGLVCYGLLGDSRFAMVSATSSSVAVLVAASLSVTGDNNVLRLERGDGMVLIGGLSLMFAASALLRVGSVSDFIAKPVLRGFAFGLAIVIILSQVANIVGMHPLHGDLIRFVFELVCGFALWNWTAAVASVAPLLLALLSAIVIDALGHTMRPAAFRAYFAWHRDRLVVVAAVLVVFAFGVLGRLDGGHLLVSRKMHPGAEEVSGILILRPDTGLFFGNAERILAQVRKDILGAGDTVRVLIVSLDESPDLGSTSVEATSDCCAAF